MSTSRPRTLDPANLDPLVTYLAHALGAERVRVSSAELLSGGAVQENWSLYVEVVGGPRAGSARWVLRTDAAARLPVSLDRTGEFAVLQTANAAGVRIAEPILECADAAVIGAPFMLQAFLAGTAQARRLVRTPDLAAWGGDVAVELAHQLAKIHAIRPGLNSAERLSFLPQPLLPPARAEVARLRGMLDGAGEARPALEYALTWLDQNAPAPNPLCLVHGDYRTGNYMVADGQLSAILDWEFAHWGDPLEDIGWFCARCWRFGNDAMEAGGIARRDVFVDAYVHTSDLSVRPADIIYWEVMAAVKWAAIAVLQGDRYRKGGEDAIELVLTGLMPSEMELDALLLIEQLEGTQNG
ncbi:MAG: phosphotransferase family protein [Pseudomonadota bacterium]